jgi:hypothetical protein
VGACCSAFLLRLTLVVGVIGCVSIPVAAADRVALVIGNGKYVNANTLQNPPNDARAVAKALSTIDFDVSFGEDLDRARMERLVRDFLRKATTAKIALLFYAGHGLQVDGRNYLIPIDAKLEAASDLNYETIKLDDILDSLNEPARATIIILDACRDNPLARSFAARLGASRSTAVSTGLAAYSTVGAGTLIAFSTAPGQVALDGDRANSPFTEGLLKYLTTPGLEVRQMLTRVRDDVARATRDRQVPWDNSSLRGDVYLANTPNAAAAAAPSADEVAWNFVKDSRDSEQVRRFIEQFPRSARLGEAAERLAALQPRPGEADALARDTAKKLQMELRRVGCFAAEPDGDWNAVSVHALESFNRYSGSSLDAKVASLDAVKAVHDKTARICPLVCDSGHHRDGDRCVPTVREYDRAPRYRAEQRVRRHEPSEANGQLPKGATIDCAPALQPCQ